jgi:hypothetical protein
MERERYWSAFYSGDADNTCVAVGEAVGLIHDAPSVRAILDEMVSQAERLLKGGPDHLVAAT